MTERDAIKEVVEQSITTKVDIEVLRKWLKQKYNRCLKYTRRARNVPYDQGYIDCLRDTIHVLDELEVGND